MIQYDIFYPSYIISKNLKYQGIINKLHYIFGRTIPTNFSKPTPPLWDLKKLRMLEDVGNFLQHMVSWCPFLDSHPTIH